MGTNLVELLAQYMHMASKVLAADPEVTKEEYAQAYSQFKTALHLLETEKPQRDPDPQKTAAEIKSLSQQIDEKNLLINSMIEHLRMALLVLKVDRT